MFFTSDALSCIDGRQYILFEARLFLFVTDDVRASLLRELQERGGDEQRVHHPVEPSVAPAFEAMEEEQDFRSLQVRVFRQYQCRQVLLARDRHLFPYASEVVEILDLDAEPDDDGLPAIAFRYDLERRGGAEISPRLVACGGDLQVGGEEFQELFGRPVAFAHVSNLLLLLEPCGGFLPVGLLPHDRLMIDFHKIRHVVLLYFYLYFHLYLPGFLR